MKGGSHSECRTTSSVISNLRREFTFSQNVVFNTAVFTTLRSRVMCDMCMEATICILLLLLLYIMKLCVLSYYKAHNYVMY